MKTRQVTVYKWDTPFLAGRKKEVLGAGIFHQFGLNYEEFDTGPGSYTTAIVEMCDGSVINVDAEMIVFDGEKVLREAIQGMKSITNNILGSDVVMSQALP